MTFFKSYFYKLGALVNTAIHYHLVTTGEGFWSLIVDGGIYPEMVNTTIHCHLVTTRVDGSGWQWMVVDGSGW